MELIAIVMKSNEYNLLDSDGKNGEKAFEANQTEIELDIQTLSMKKIRYLKRALTDQQFQMQIMQQANQPDAQAALQ